MQVTQAKVAAANGSASAPARHSAASGTRRRASPRAAALTSTPASRSAGWTSRQWPRNSPALQPTSSSASAPAGTQPIGCIGFKRD